MLLPAIADFFKLKFVANVVVLACWSQNDQVQFVRRINDHGIRATFSCSENIAFKFSANQILGVVYFAENYSLPEMVSPENLSIRYKWLIIGDHLPSNLNTVRYDADMTLLRSVKRNYGQNIPDAEPDSPLQFEDIYIHPVEGPRVHPWAVWSKEERFQLKHENDRLFRRNNLRKHSLKISTPLSHYIEADYGGSFHDYVLDNRKLVPDSAVGCGFGGAELLIDALNATGVLSPILLWEYIEEDNRSMVHALATGQAELGGGVLWPSHDRLLQLDFITPLWPFRAGFTYLADHSHWNMFIMPFSAGVWWSCLVSGLIIAVVQRLTAKTPMEREGALSAVLATFLQQDASAVPAGGSGRVTFTVLSLWAMMLYAYYSSAIVSALMNTGQNELHCLRELADSKYAIAADGYAYDYVGLLFDKQTDWPDLEYLKKKKITDNFYQTMQRGVELLREGQTAFHAEFNHIYPHLKTLSDDQVCMLSYIDTIPEVAKWIVAPRNSQFTNVLRIAGVKIHERGLANRVVAYWRMWPPPCRSAVLIDSITIGDVAPLLGISMLGVVLSMAFLALEIFYVKWRKDSGQRVSDSSVENLVHSTDVTID